jgi:hypothetical protein
MMTSSALAKSGCESELAASSCDAVNRLDILVIRDKKFESTCYRNHFNDRNSYVRLRQTPGTGIWSDRDGDT